MTVLSLIMLSFLVIVAALVFVSAEPNLKQRNPAYRQQAEDVVERNYLVKAFFYTGQRGKQGHVHVWPVS